MNNPHTTLPVLNRALLIAAQLLMAHGYHVDGIREPKALYEWLLREGERSLHREVRRELWKSERKSPRKQ